MKKLTLIFIICMLVMNAFGDNPTNAIKKSQGLCFIENKGQFADQNNNPKTDVLYGGADGQFAFHIKKKGISYQLSKIDEFREGADSGFYSSSFLELGVKQKLTLLNKKYNAKATQTIYRIDINWLNCNTNYSIITDEALPGCNNYYLPQCPEGALNVKSFKGVTFQNLYNKIDLHYYEKNGHLKYDYIVAPNANYKEIKLQIFGAEINQLEDGSLVLKTPLGEIKEDKPIVFQNGKQLNAKWRVLKNEIKKENEKQDNHAVTVGFEIQNYDSNKELIIDPTVSRLWGTYFGAEDAEYGASCCTDASGNVYMSGETHSDGNFLSTSGAHQISRGDPYAADAFLVKFNSSGVRQWGTYYGGIGFDFGYDCKADVQGNIYLVGMTDTPTSSLNVIATNGAHQTNSGATSTSDPRSAFLVKFNNNGVRLWGTYYGAGINDIGYSCDIDNSGNVYLAGTTYSSQNTGTAIATNGAHQSSFGGNSDAFLVKFNSNGVRQWGTYYGGSGDDFGYDCKTDAQGNIYLSGATNSGSGTVMATSQGHQNALNGNTDAFLVKFNSNGIRQWGTYYGESDVDIGYSCATDTAANVYLAGSTGTTSSSSGTIIATSGAHQTTNGGDNDGFLVKFNANGVRQWGTYYGAASFDRGFSCATDILGNVYLTGITDSTAATTNTVIATSGAHQTTNAGDLDAFLVKFNTNGVREWGTFYGDIFQDEGRSCAIDAFGNIYLAGPTSCNTNTSTVNNAIATNGSQQSLHGGSYNSWGRPFDAFLVKFKECPIINPILSPTNPICFGNTLNFTTNISTTLALTYNWVGPNSFSANVQNPSINNIQYSASGIYTLIADAGNSCIKTSTIQVTVYQPTVVATPINTAICIGNSLTIIASGANSYTWNTNANSSLMVVSPTVNTTYSVLGMDLNGCMNSASTSINVNGLPTVAASSSHSLICSGSAITLSAVGANTYTWSTLSIGGVISASPTVASTINVIGTDNNGCNNTASVSVSVNPLPNITTIVSNSAICIGNSVTIFALGANSYTWNNSVTNSLIVTSPSATSNFTVWGTDANNCINSATTNVIVHVPNITASVNNTAVCQGNSVTLTASGAITYSLNNNSTNNVMVVSPTVTAIYTVTGTDANSCVGSATTSVVVYSLPIISIISTNSSICTGSSATLIANGANSYSWSNAISTISNVVSPLTTSNFTVIGTNLNNCSNNAVFNLIVNPLPTITVVRTNTAICAGSSATLTANGATTYTWNGTITGSAIVVSPTLNSLYTIIGKDANNCVNNALTSLTVLALPNVIAASSASQICMGNTVVLNANGANSYTWNGSIFSQSTIVSPTSTSIFSVIGTGANNCSKIAMITITVHPLPALNITATNHSICVGNSITLSANGANTYTWNNSITGSVNILNPTISASYSVIGIDLKGCQNHTHITITVHPLPIINISTSRNVLCGPPNQETAILTSIGASTYTWNTSVINASIAISPSVTSTFSVLGQDLNGCINSAIITQSVSNCTDIRRLNTSQNEIKIFPNPTNGIFNIQIPLNAKIEIVNAIGQILMVENKSIGIHTMDINTFSQGVYLIKILINKEENIYRLIKY